MKQTTSLVLKLLREKAEAQGLFLAHREPVTETDSESRPPQPTQCSVDKTMWLITLNSVTSHSSPLLMPCNALREELLPN